MGSCRACQAKRAFLLPSLLSSFSPVFYSLFSLPKPKIMSECLPPGRSGSTVWWQGEILPCLVALPSLCAPGSSWVTGIFHQDLPGGGSAPARGFGADSELCGALGRSLLKPSPGSTWSRALQVEERYCMVTLSTTCLGPLILFQPQPVPVLTPNGQLNLPCKLELLRACAQQHSLSIQNQRNEPNSSALKPVQPHHGLSYL